MTQTNEGTEVAEFQIKVKNISWEATEQDVESFLKNITSVEQVKLLVNTKTGRSKGYAYAKLTDQEALDQALAATNLDHMGRQLLIVPAKSTKSLYVGNLSKNVTEETLRSFFSSCGGVQEVQIVTDKQSNESKGFGYVDFNNNNSVQAALKLNGKSLEGQEVIVEYKRQKRQQRRQQSSQYRRGGNRSRNPERRGDDERSGNQRRNDRQNDRDYDRRENRGQQRPRQERQERPQRQQNDSTSVYVGNLSFKTTEDSLRDFFEQSGTVTNVNIVLDRDTGKSRGYGFVNFELPEAAQDALRFNNEELDGRQIKVDLQQSRSNNGPRGGQRSQQSGQRYGGQRGYYKRSD